ncbi:MAG: hypothetical protein IJX94_01500 [Clostridia bacterium]|nr:hypothetical protein [Clostridia bacterium]
MKYEINFDNNAAEKTFLDLYHSIAWSERNFEDGDLVRNVGCTATFEAHVQFLRAYGAKTETGTYNDNGFLRIGYASINGHEFVKNGKLNAKELKDALWEIAHPEGN